jgi:hypothetical protein
LFVLKDYPVNWFEKHLNWTAIIITFGGLAFTCLVALITLGLNLVARPSLLAFEFRLYLTLGTFFATLVSIACMAWIIRKKHRHLIFLIFFIPSALYSLVILLVLFPALDVNRCFFSEQIYLAPFLLFLLSTLFWVIGLVLTLLLIKRRNRFLTLRPEPSTEVQAENTEHRKVIAERRIQHGFVPVLGLLLLITLVIAGISCFRINTGYQVITYENHNSPREENLHYSQIAFECPKSYCFSWGGDLFWYPGDEITLMRDRIKPFALESTRIQINISPYVIKEGNPVYPSLVEQCIYFYFQSWYGRNLRNNIEIKNLTVTKTIVDGITADYASFLTYYPEPFFYPFSTWNEVKLVCFEREGIIWTLCMEKADGKTISSNSVFDHLLKSFKIYQ